MSGTFSCLHIHIVFSVKHRRPHLGDEWRPELFAYMAGTLKNHEVHVVQIGGTADHVHALVGLRTKHSVMNVVASLKKASGNWIRANHRGEFAWQDGYGAFAVGRERVEQVRQYVANQEEHHRKVDAREEFLRLCLEHGIEFDEQFVE